MERQGSKRAGRAEAVEQAWQRIADQVNAAGHNDRTPAECKAKMKNLTTKAKMRYMNVVRSRQKKGLGVNYEKDIRPLLSEFDHLAIMFLGLETVEEMAGIKDTKLQEEEEHEKEEEELQITRIKKIFMQAAKKAKQELEKREEQESVVRQESEGPVPMLTDALNQQTKVLKLHTRLLEQFIGIAKKINASLDKIP